MDAASGCVQDKRTKNLVLIGFMGSGKTTVGRLVSVELGMPFVDMDRMIEEREGKSVADIFHERGEAVFRDIESAVVGQLAKGRGHVIASGGGVVLRPSNTEALGRTGVLIHLRVNPETVLARTRGDHRRPLLEGQGEVRARVESLLKERQPLYEAIPWSVEATGRSTREVARDVIAIYLAQTGAGAGSPMGSV